MNHIVAPGRSLRHSKIIYPAGADAPEKLTAAEKAELIADGTLIQAMPPATKPKPEPRGKVEASA